VQEAVVCQDIGLNDLGIVEINIISLDMHGNGRVVVGVENHSVYQEACVSDFLQRVSSI
jgi:hypothetical protein